MGRYRAVCLRTAARVWDDLARADWAWAGRRIVAWRTAAGPVVAPAVVALAVVAASFFALAVVGCTSDPNAPINQTPPIRQMDHFFDSLSGPSAPDYEHQPGYAPAYPPY